MTPNSIVREHYTPLPALMAYAWTKMLFASMGMWGFASAPPAPRFRKFSELTPAERAERMREVNMPKAERLRHLAGVPSRLDSQGTFTDYQNSFGSFA